MGDEKAMVAIAWMFGQCYAVGIALTKHPLAGTHQAALLGLRRRDRYRRSSRTNTSLQYVPGEGQNHEAPQNGNFNAILYGLSAAADFGRGVGMVSS